MSSNKAKAAAIGDIDCISCGEIAVVRKKSSGTLYVWCAECGLFSMTMPKGQNYILTHARIWSEGQTPANLPEWIRENRAWLHPPKRTSRAPSNVIHERVNGDAEVQGVGAIASPAPIQRPVLQPDPTKPSPATPAASAATKKKDGLFEGGIF